MNPDENLKRIEAKHRGYHWCFSDPGWQWKSDGEPPCDVVTLARELSEAIRLFHMTGRDEDWVRRWKRTLEEVAGE
jgi:hypothetical protein